MQNTCVNFRYCKKFYLISNRLKNVASKAMLSSFSISKHNFCSSSLPTTSNQSNEVVQQLVELLSCKFTVAKKIYHEFPSIGDSDKMPEVRNNVKLLTNYGIKVESIIENPVVLVLPTSKLFDNISDWIVFIYKSLLIAEILREKLDILTKMKPKNLNDLLPMVELDVQKLLEFMKLSPADRIYYFSKELKVSVTTYFSPNKNK